MISLLVPAEERDFNQNSVGRGGLSYQGVGVIAPRPGSDQTTLLAAHHDGKRSPNNNSYRAATLTTGPLDNRPTAAVRPTVLSLTRDLRLADDSSSDDATSGSGSGSGPLALPPVDDTSDEPMSPAERRPASPVRRQSRRASSLAPLSARSGKLKRVSFGSSKGSMVETLIYDCEPTPPRPERDSSTWQAGGRRAPAGRHSACHGGPPAAGGTPGLLPGSAPRVLPSTVWTSGSAARPPGTAARPPGSAARPPGSAARPPGTAARPPGSAARPLSAPPRPTSIHSRPEDGASQKATSRVRVTYYESKRPLSVSGSSSEGSDVCERGVSRRTVAPEPAAVTATVTDMPSTYIVSSVDAGWENPFRPGGELSKEADQIVRAIQSGRPLDSSVDSADGPVPAATATTAAATTTAAVSADSPAGGDSVPAGNGHASPPANGKPALPPPEVAVKARAASQTAAAASSPPPGATVLAAQPPGTVEVRHSVAAAPEGAAQVERVALKKKPRARCCVVQ